MVKKRGGGNEVQEVDEVEEMDEVEPEETYKHEAEESDIGIIETTYLCYTRVLVGLWSR